MNDRKEETFRNAKSSATRVAKSKQEKLEQEPITTTTKVMK